MRKPKLRKPEPKPITAQPVGVPLVDGGSRVQGDRNVHIGARGCFITPKRKPAP